MEFDSTASIEKMLRNAELAKAEKTFATSEIHLERLRDEPEHEDRTVALQLGREDRLKAKHALRDAIIGEAQKGTITFDESLGLFRHFNIKFEGGTAIDYEPLLDQFTEGDEILLQRSVYYREHLLGYQASPAQLVPHKLKFMEAVLPAIYVSVMVDGVIDTVHVSIRESGDDGSHIYGVQLGAEAIEKFLKTNR